MSQASFNTRPQFRGFLFELVIGKLLEMNSFKRVSTFYEPRNRVREKRPTFTELRGRGCWHQIDCPYDYKLVIPFSYPLRLLGEVKFLRKPVEKDDIREFIGVIKDIQENYFTDIDAPIEEHYPRKQEVGVFISANGFDNEAELLAYAHCIKTLSYANNPLILNIKNDIYTLSENYLIPSQLSPENRSILRGLFREFDGDFREIEVRNLPIFREGYASTFQNLLVQLQHIRASFMGVTETGIFLHFTSLFPFPFHLFRSTDSALCRVYFDLIKSKPSEFRLVFSDDSRSQEFFFSPPAALLSIAQNNPKNAIYYKESHFQTINVNIFDDSLGIQRNLRLILDQRWIIEAYDYR